MKHLLLATSTALALLASPALAEDYSFGYDNPRDCLYASPSGVCRTVESPMTLNELLRQLTDVTLEEVAADNQIPVEMLQGGEIMLYPGRYFAT